ncbi:hypothetical protein PSP6_290086 [Paraburkholderia tropica]|nr:hypothetical protein PSP6_290086 [Paraburkholderia tropica]
MQFNQAIRSIPFLPFPPFSLPCAAAVYGPVYGLCMACVWPESAPVYRAIPRPPIPYRMTPF